MVGDVADSVYPALYIVIFYGNADFFLVDVDFEVGVARAASRLMESLKNNGIKAKMLVRDKQTDQICVVRLKSNWLQVR